MSRKRSARPARMWVQAELLPFDLASPAPAQGVGGRQATPLPSRRGGGYLNGCTASEVGQGPNAPRKKFAKFALSGAGAPDQIREAQLLFELDAMGLSTTMLQVAAEIGFDNFMAMWQILDRAPEALTETESAIHVRLPRLQAYRRYQRNRFVEALAAAGWTQPEIRAKVKAELGEKLSDRHMRRLMQSHRVRA